MTPRFESNDWSLWSAARNVSKSDNEPEALTVQDAMHLYREPAMNMSFAKMLEWQKRDAELAWMVACVQKRESALRAAAIKTIAYGLTLQQTGYLAEAKACFLYLLHKLDVEYDASMPRRLYDKLGTAIADDALVLYFRQNPEHLGTAACEMNLQVALRCLRLNINKAKFFWRLQFHRVIADQTVDVTGVQQRYTELAGLEWAAAAGNAKAATFAQSLLQASRERPDRCAKPWDDALHLATYALNAVQANLLNRRHVHGHLVTHAVLNGLCNTVTIKWHIAQRRGKRAEMRDLEILWNAIDILRHDAGILCKADGFRENLELHKAIFGMIGKKIYSNPNICLNDKAINPLSRAQRLRNLCDQVRDI